MEATAILYQIDVDEKAYNQLKQLQETWKNIKKKLNDMKEGEDITFDQVLRRKFKCLRGNIPPCYQIKLKFS